MDLGEQSGELVPTSTTPLWFTKEAGMFPTKVRKGALGQQCQKPTQELNQRSHCPGHLVYHWSKAGKEMVFI